MPKISKSQKKEITNYLNQKGYIPPEKRSYNITLNDGTKLGTVSHSAYQAIISNQADKYSPKNDEEKKVIDEYKKRISGNNESTQTPSATPKMSKDEESAVLRYGIDANNFTFKDLAKWANDHNHKLETTSSMGVTLTPKYTGGFLGIGSKKQSTDQEDADAKILYNIAKNNANKKASETVPGKVMNTIGYTGEKIVGGAVDAVGDLGDYAMAGLHWTGGKLAEILLPKNMEGAITDKAKKAVDYRLNAKTLGDIALEDADKRFGKNVPEWYKEYIAPTAEAAGAMTPAIIAEVLTMGASPMLDLQMAKMATTTSKLGTTWNATKNVLKRMATRPSSLVKPSEVIFGTGAAASATKQAYGETGDLGKSVTYGILSGLGEVATERLFGGFAGTEFGEAVFEWTVKNKALRKLLNIGSEALEEMIMTGADTYFKRATIDPNASLPTPKEVGESGLQGILLSTFMGIGTMPVRKIQKTKAIEGINTAIDSINEMIPNPDKKITPLDKKADYETIEAKQKEIRNYTEELADAVEYAAETLNSPEVIEAERQRVVAENATPDTSVETTSEETAPVVEETAPTETPSAKVGDILKDTKTGYNATITARDAENTTITIDRGTSVETIVVSNEQLDNVIARGQLEKTNTTVSAPKNINLRRVGKNYEVYGNDALTLASEIDNLETTKGVVNGVETDILRIPANMADDLAKAFDGEYNLVMNDKAVQTTPTTANTTVKSTSNETPSEKPSVKVGDVYKANGTNQTYTITGRNDTHTTYTLTDGKNSKTNTVSNVVADTVFNNPDKIEGYTKVSDTASEAKNQTVPNKTDAGNETTTSKNRKPTEGEIAVVSEAIRQTLTAESKKDLENGQVKENYARIAESLINVYGLKGTITEDFAPFFADGGKKVDEVIGKVFILRTMEDDVNVSETKDNTPVVKEATTDEKNVSEPKVLKNQSESDTIKSKAEETSVEREGNDNESIREGLLHGDGKRRGNESTRKQTERLLSFRRKNQGKNETERRDFARELIERGQVEEVVDGNYKYMLVNKDAYNDDMLSMVKEAKKHGIELVFCVDEMTAEVTLDDGTKVTKNIRGLKISPTQILVRYDANRAPQQIFKHEYVHAKYKTPAMQKIKNFILGSLSEETKQDILSQERYANYAEAYRNNKEKVWEEFVCDVMSGMSDYAERFADTVVDYWEGNETADSYNVAEYAESIDAGGKYDLSDEGGEHNEKRNNSRGISRISENSRDKRGRDSSGERGSLRSIRQVSVSEDFEKLPKPSTRNTSENTARSSETSLDNNSESALAMGREGKGGSVDYDRRYTEALRKGNKTLARNLLDEQATKSGYVPVTRYRGEKSKNVKTSFKDNDIVWVSTTFDYAEKYAQNGEFTDAKMSEQLHTSKHSNVYDLYAKYGKVLELGDIEQTIESVDDLNEFANKIGFTTDEVIECMDDYRRVGTKYIYSITYTKKFADLARKKGYDSLHALEDGGEVETYGILYPENVKSAKLETYDDNGNLIPLSKRFDNSNDDIRYDIDDADTNGNTLTEAQQEYFKDSKVRDENGSLRVMYQGSANDFTVFDRKKSSYANLYGRGFYFTESEAHAKQYGNTKAYYLNIKNPVSTTETTITKPQLRKFLEVVSENEDYGFENYGYGATIDDVVKNVYGKSDFLMLYDINQTAIGDLVEAVELFNEVNGTNFDGLILDTETVTFNSEQAKLTSNEAPTSEPDIRFDLSEPVEETKNLIAVHNMQVSELERTLDLGGLPMPSIAIIKAQRGHSEYGDVSLVFNKETIDPKANKSNKVYGGDAWTPTYPTIEYKPNEKVAKKISDKYYELSRKFGYDESRPLYNYVNDLERQLNTHKGEAEMINELYDDTKLMQLYLLDSGKSKVETVKKETRTELTDAEVKMHEFFINELGAEVVDEVKWDGKTKPQTYRKNYMSKYEGAIREAYKKLLSQEYQFTEEEVQNVLDSTKTVNYLNFVREAQRYRENGRVTIKTEDDYSATEQAIRDAVGDDYRKWVDSLFKGIEEKSGIRNNVDYFTNSGNRRSWEALHWENNLENVVKVMKSQEDVGGGFFGGQGIWGVSAKDFKSIEEIKADSNRLKQMSEEEYQKIKDSFGDRMSEVAHSIMDKSERNPFIAVDNAMECIVDAVRHSKSRLGILKNLKQYQHLTVTEKAVKDIISLVSDIANMPTEYFEAKPKRAVELNEIATAIIPDTTSGEIKSKLDDMGIKYLEYESGNEDSRLDALNSLEDVRFDLSESETLTTQKRIEEIANDVVTHEELIELAKKNTKEFVGKIRENESLQKRLKNAKRQMLVSPNPSVNVVKVGQVTKDILKEMDSTLKATDLKDDIMSIYNEYVQAVKKASGVESKVQEANDNMTKRFAELAVDIADSSEVYVESEMYSLLKSYIKDTRIKIPDHAKEEADYAEFRKSHMGTFNLTNDGLDIDVVYQELCSMFPGMFSTDVASPADQLHAIAEKLESLKPYAYNPHSDYMQDAVEHIVYRFVSEVDGIAANPKTKAQKMAEKASVDKAKAIDKERTAFERKLEKHKKNSEKTIQKLQKKIDDSNYVRYWEKRLGKEEKARAVQEVRDRQKKALLKSRIRSIVFDMKKKLDKSEKTGGYPKELVKTVAEVCSALDFHTGKTNKDGSPTKTSLRLDSLMAEYNALKNNENYDFASEYRQELSDKISNLYQAVKDKRVVDLNLNELSELKDILSEISHSLSIATQQIGKANAKANAELAWGIIESVEANSDLNDMNKRLLLREHRIWKRAKVSNIFNPHRINEMIAGYDKESVWWQLHDDINRGNRKSARFVMEANKPFDELTDDGGNEIAFYDFRTEKIKTGIKYTDGTEVEIPKSIICEMLMMWNRKDGKTHLETGGAKIPDMELYNKGKTIDAIKGGKRTNPITVNDIVRLRGLLDSYDLAWIERAHHLFNKVSQDAINSTSIELVGRELARSENYIRMYVDSDFIGKEVGKDENNNITLEGHGSLKETKPKAKQPLLFRGLHENVYDNIDFVSKYYGLAIPIRNFNKVYRMTFRDENGQSSVQEVIGKKFGAKIQIGVVEQYIKDLQTPRNRPHNEFDAIKGRWLNSIFTLAIGSTMKQTSSYWTASALLGEDSLVKGLKNFAKNAKQTKAEIDKYSGTLYKRSQGLSTTELGDRANRKRLAGASNQIAKLVNEKAPILRKIPQGIRPGNWLQSMDVNVSASLWEACKLEVAKTMKTSDDGYMQAVTDLWERVIEETQSNYDIIHRPEVLKDTRDFTQLVAMFTTDAYQKFGLFFSAYNDLVTKSELYKKDGSEANENAKKEAGKRLFNASRSIVYSALWMGLMKVLRNVILRKFKSLIDDEERDITASSVSKQYVLSVGEDLFASFMPINSSLILQMADAVSKGYDFVGVPSFDVAEKFITSMVNVGMTIADEDKGVNEIINVLLDSAPDIGNCMGAPLGNLTDIIKSIKGYAGDIKELDFAHDIEEYTSGNKSFYSYGDLASRIVSGDNEKEKKILDYYSENGKEISKGTLTKEIKPAYVQMFVDSPEKASAIKRKLVLDYDYTGDSIDSWITEEWVRNVVEDFEYAEEIKTATQDKWDNISAYNACRDYYKKIYKKGKEKDIKATRDAFINHTNITENDMTTWEAEVDWEKQKKESKLEAEKEQYR